MSGLDDLKMIQPESIILVQRNVSEMKTRRLLLENPGDLETLLFLEELKTASRFHSGEDEVEEPAVKLLTTRGCSSSTNH